MQSSFKIHKILEWLERELIAVLAVGIVGLGSLWALADGSSVVSMSLQVIPPGGFIEVSAPNGGESWTVDSVQNITWSALGDVTDVKIELQRTVAGAWVTIIASTSNDGSYPWTVTSPTTDTATIRISKVGDDAVNDTSDTVFRIVSEAGGGGGGGSPSPPGIDSVLPNIISNNNATVVLVTGANFDPSIGVRLNSTIMSSVQWMSSTQLKFTVPAGFPIGVYSLVVYDGQGRTGVWGSYVWIVSGQIDNQIPPSVPIPPIVIPPTPTPPIPPIPVVNLYYSSRLVNQSTQTMTLTTGQETMVWAEFFNDGTLPWDNFSKNPTRLGTSNPRDRLSVFRAYWFSGWISKNRPANVSHTDQQAGGRQTINPGETGRFTFKLKAPSRVGKYVESFGTVVEFREWMQEGAVKWDVTVVPKTVYKTPTTITPVSPSPTVAPTPTPPADETVFYDGLESWLKRISSFFNWLVSGF